MQNQFIERYRCAIRIADLRHHSDPELLALFVRDGDEVAFEALLRRHGPMVMGVCLRILRHRQDAEDAFQATFLLFAQRAPELRTPRTLGNWLFGAARRTALAARKVAARHRDKERRCAPMPGPTKDTAWDETLALLDEQLAALPAKYRVVVLLCDLYGETRAAVAARLGCPEGTVASRLARGRSILARRLTRRGVALSFGGVAGMLATQTATAVPPLVLQSTARLATLMSSGAASVDAASASVLTILRGVPQVTAFSTFRWVMLATVGAAVASGVLFSWGRAEPRAAAPVPKVGQEVVNRVSIDGVVGTAKVQPPAALIERGAAAAVQLLVESQLTDFLNPGQMVDRDMWKEQVTEGVGKGREYVRVRFAKPKPLEVNLNGRKAQVSVSEIVFFDPAERGPICLWARDGETYYFANQLSGQGKLVEWLAQVLGAKKPPTE